MNNANKMEKFSKTVDDIKKLLKNIDAFQIVNNLYKIECKELTMIISSLHGAKLPRQYSSYKDVLKEQLELTLKLKPKDIILFLDGFIYIKIFLHVDNKQSQERRACGVSPELLQTYKEEYFEDNSHLDFVFALLSCATEDTLSFNKIDPIKFSKIFIPVFVNIFEIVIIESTDIKDEQVIRGFSFYLLREVFDEIMLRIAEDILFNFSNQNKKAIEFFKLFERK